ncbi:UNVERIFIED_CONTAM: hypothetical protein FKN15_010588 [Acipenser sinensis]
MGTNASALEKDIGPEQFPINEHYFGLVNFGNTCYCNSVLQALYFCRPFRENVLAYKAQQKKKENLLTCLADLFHSITTQKKKVGVIPPKKFISRLRKENALQCTLHSTLLHNALLHYPLVERWLCPHPMALCQGRLDYAPGKVAHAGSHLHSLPHLLPLLLFPRSKRSVDLEQMEKLWAAV